MKKEARLLLEKACNSLILAIEYFNRPWDRGRTEAVLIFLDHAFEMQLKAGILYKGGKIRERGAKQTIGFDACVRRALTSANVKFLTPEQALTLQAINGLRDAAQHHLVDVSEGQLYLHAQSGLTLFRDLYDSVFGKKFSTELPTRVLPLSTSPPIDLATLFDSEIEEVRKLLAPKKRKQFDAETRLRGLAILESAISGEQSQPSTSDLRSISGRIRKGEKWQALFPGVASLDITTSGGGPKLCLRFTKKEGIPIRVVGEGEGEGLAVAIKRVNELDFYSLGLMLLARHLKISAPRALALAKYLGIQNEEDCYKVIRIGSQVWKRYSQKALERMREELPKVDMAEVWKVHGAH
jgi:hypothetical protein